MKHLLHAFFLTVLCSWLAGCSEIDCPLGNIVALHTTVFSAESESALSLPDTLCVRTPSGEVLINRAIGVSSLALPLSYEGAVDTLLFCFSDKESRTATDTVFVEKTSHAHFESIDCPVVMFHKVKDVRWTSHPLAQLPLTISHVTIQKPSVSYDETENIRVYLRTVTVE